MALTTNIVAYYKLDGNSNDAVGSNNGTDTAITYSAGNGKIVQGAGFNGTTSQIIGGAISISSAASFSYWFKTTQTTPNYVFQYNAGAAGNNQNPQIEIGGINGGGTVFFSVKDSNAVTGQVSSNSGLNDGNWHFIVCILNGISTGATIQMYVDGISQASPPTVNYTGNFNTMYLCMGMGVSGSYHYTGDLVEV